MSDQEKIQKMAADICRVKHNCNDVCNPINSCMALKYSRRAYEAGYRKQSEGKWKLHKDGSGTCDQCGTTQKNVWDYDNWQNYCGHCGARMKGAVSK